MNKYGTVGLAIVSGFTLGAVAVENLRAQSTAPVFIVGEIEVTDQAGYREFAAKSQAGIRAAGGQLLVIGGSPIPHWGTAEGANCHPSVAKHGSDAKVVRLSRAN
jgi:Domain of unknown function (DUF1330)